MIESARNKINTASAAPRCAGILVLIGLICWWSLYTPAEAKPRGVARIAVDAQTGEILYSSRSQVRWHPASLTKMMTLYHLFSALQRDKVSMNTRIRISRRAARQPPSKLGIRPGGSITVSAAIRALAIKSANDIAVAVAEKLAGSEVAFARQMNRTARHLGMSGTNFRNASGLHHSKQVTTARDMAILSIALMRDFPQYYDYFSMASFRYGKRTYRSHNRILKQYNGADGIKTGYIAKSGFNLAASAVRKETRVVAVVLGANSSNHRSALMTRLLDTGFDELKKSGRARIARPLPIRLASPPPIPRPRPGLAPLIGRAVISTPVAASAPIPRPDPRKLRATPVAVATIVATPKTALPAFGAPVPKPGPRTGGIADGNYAVQVGAFRSKRQAKVRLSQVLDRLPSSHAEAEPAIVTTRSGSQRVLYRARLTGYEELADANATCRWLKARKSDCMVVQINS